MAADPAPLKVGDSGGYAELAARPNPDKLALQYIPALAALLSRAEELKGEPLTREQVEAIRDHASVMALPPAMVKASEAERGYTDIAPGRAWEEWQKLRATAVK